MEQDNKFIRSLVQSAQSGKVVALEELYKMNLNRIYAIALRTTANKPLAALLTQNTFINAWQQLSRVRAEVPFADWLKSMAIYDSLKEIREGKLQKDKKALKQFGGDGKSDKHFNDPVEKAISELPDKQRIAVVLHLIEKYSIAEIADLQSSTKNKTDEVLAEAIETIRKSVDELKSDVEIIEHIKNLPKEIESHYQIIPNALEAIREVKIEEFKEAESAIEEKEKLEKEEEIEEIQEEKKEKEKKPEKTDKQKRKVNKKPILIMLTVILVIAAIYYVASITKVWTISDHTGNYTLNNNANTATKLSNGDILSTISSSSVIISIPDVGKIKLLENTSLKRLDEDNAAQLIKGDVVVENSGALENFQLQIPSAIIEDFYTGNNYNVSVDEESSSLIKISSGWLRVRTQLDESIFPQGYELKVNKERGMGLPYSSDSDPAYVFQLDEYIFNGKKLNVLGIVLSKSTVKDAITLWNLFKRVDEIQRDQVYTKLAELVPPPSALKKQELLNLNPEAIQIWLEEIEWNM